MRNLSPDENEMAIIEELGSDEWKKQSLVG